MRATAACNSFWRARRVPQPLSGACCLKNSPAMQIVTTAASSGWQTFRTEGGIPCGSISGLASEMAPLVTRVIFTNMRPLLKISDPHAKQYATLRVILSQPNVGSLITANPSTLVELAKVADRERE